MTDMSHISVGVEETTTLFIPEKATLGSHNLKEGVK